MSGHMLPSLPSSGDMCTALLPSGMQDHELHCQTLCVSADILTKHRPGTIMPRTPDLWLSPRCHGLQGGEGGVKEREGKLGLVFRECLGGCNSSLCSVRNSAYLMRWQKAKETLCQREASSRLQLECARLSDWKEKNQHNPPQQKLLRPRAPATVQIGVSQQESLWC